MAAAVASSAKGLPLAGPVEKVVLAKPSGASGVAYYPITDAEARRLFSSLGLPLSLLDKVEKEKDESSDNKRDLTSTDLAKPFGAPKTLGKLLSKTMEDVARTGLGSLSLAAPGRGWWVAKQDDDEVTLKVPMPGLEKEHVEVRADKNVLVIKGEGRKGTEEDKEGEELRYINRIELPADAFKMDQVRAAMKNGLLTVTVPRLKEEERRDVFVVNVE